MIKQILRDKLYGFSIKGVNRHFIVSQTFDENMFKKAKLIWKKGDLLSIEELIKIGQLIEETNKLEGNIAEVGVYKGASAEMIAKCKVNKKLFLFDTFKGLPNKSNNDENIKDLDLGNFKCSKIEVNKRMRDYKNVLLFEGFFPNETGIYVEKDKFCFVHLDLDLYESTIKSLNLFWDKLIVNGMILCHDYPALKGILKAIDSFTSLHNLIKIQISGNQVLLIKIKEK